MTQLKSPPQPHPGVRLPTALRIPVTTLGLGVAFAFTPVLSALADSDSVVEIIVKHETAKVAELQAYVAANPGAEDLPLAWAALSESLGVIGDDEALIGVLEQRYAAAEKTSDDRMILGEWLQEVVGPLMGMYVDTGNREQAAELLDRVLADTADNPMAGDIAQYVEFMRGQLDRPAVGDEMEIAFTAIDGREVDLAAMEGKVVLVDFWATWCQPCVVELPHIKAAYEAYHDKGFEVIGISLDQSEQALTQFVEREGLPWPQHYTDGGNEFAEKYGISAIPATFLIGADGKVVAVDLRGEDLQVWLSELLPDA